ncbi:hypothetical protein IRJ41_002450 [Triplophysa rosa]|uniref:Uncharacterized protein n=1 Tax=Triplophysa rosa TaxID=992332 RepID=A0A9W7WKG1_TRIRA|nr:hypothetical protein IRJ41_002450 [Triplophysa rosa]
MRSHLPESDRPFRYENNEVCETRYGGSQAAHLSGELLIAAPLSFQMHREEEEEKILHGPPYNSDPGFVFILTNVLTGLKNQSSCRFSLFFISLLLLRST